MITKRLGPYILFSVGTEYVKILQEGGKRFDRINLVTRVKQVRDAPDPPLTETVEAGKMYRQSADEVQKNKDLRWCAIKKIFCHVTTTTGSYYVVRWYRYSRRDYTVRLRKVC